MGWLDQVGISLTQLSIGLKVEAELGNRMLLFLTICFVTPSLSNFFQKKHFFNSFEKGLTSPPPIWTMSLNILFFLDVTPKDSCLQ